MSGQFYCAEGYESIPLGNNSYLLFVPGSTKRYFATLPLKRVLDACHQSRLLENHVDEV